MSRDERVKHDAAKYQEVMTCLRRMRLQHGDCKRPHACTHCQAKKKLEKLVDEYKGRTIELC